MMSEYNRDEWQRMIESYNRELMTQYASVTANRTAAPTPPPIDPPANPAPPSEPPLPPVPPPPPSGPALTDIGNLQVRVSTEDQAVPIPGAVVTVTHDFGNGITLDRTMITDDNGLTAIIALPTKDRALSLRPGNPSPFAEYTVEVVADGYFTKRFEKLPIYGGVTAIQSVSMIPLPEQGDTDIPIIYPSYTPSEL